MYSCYGHNDKFYVGTTCLVELGTTVGQVLVGRQGLEGPPTKAMLLWLGAYICNWLAIFLCLVVGFSPRFHSVWSRLLCNCLVKKINQGTDVPDQLGTLSQVGTKKISKGGWTI